MCYTQVLGVCVGVCVCVRLCECVCVCVRHDDRSRQQHTDELLTAERQVQIKRFKLFESELDNRDAKVQAIRQEAQVCCMDVCMYYVYT
jgi:hypothetical protein